MKCHALILAGGQGSRLGGVRKADLRIGGVRLLDRVAARLKGAQLPLLLSVGTLEKLHLPHAVNLPDGADWPGGPMAGIRAALAHLHDAEAEDVVVTVAVDTPFLTDDYVARLVAPLRDKGLAASCASHRGNVYPTNAAWRLGALRSTALPDRPTRLLEALRAKSINWDDAAENPFANLNTIEDLVLLQRRAREAGK